MVIPLMLTEVLTLILLVYTINRMDIALILSAIMLFAVWVITAVFFSGAHQKLTLGYDKSVVDGLIKINWSRTLLWTLRLILVATCL